MPKRKQVEKRSRQANWQQVQLAEGMCPRCGQERLDTNQRTGKPYAVGPMCRKSWNAMMKKVNQRRRKRLNDEG